jgi:hypothetical protein
MMAEPAMRSNWQISNCLRFCATLANSLELATSGERSFTGLAMADTADTANVIVRPPIAWALAVLAGLALNWLMPLPFLPAVASAGWPGC